MDFSDLSPFTRKSMQPSALNPWYSQKSQAVKVEEPGLVDRLAHSLISPFVDTNQLSMVSEITVWF